MDRNEWGGRDVNRKQKLNRDAKLETCIKIIYKVTKGKMIMDKQSQYRETRTTANKSISLRLHEIQQLAAIAPDGSANKEAVRIIRAFLKERTEGQNTEGQSNV